MTEHADIFSFQSVQQCVQDFGMNALAPPPLLPAEGKSHYGFLTFTYTALIHTTTPTHMPPHLIYSFYVSEMVIKTIRFENRPRVNRFSWGLLTERGTEAKD